MLQVTKKMTVTKAYVTVTLAVSFVTQGNVFKKFCAGLFACN